VDIRLKQGKPDFAQGVIDIVFGDLALAAQTFKRQLELVS